MANFTSNKINETYQRIVQVDRGTIQDGLGRILSGSMSDLTVNGVLEVSGSINVDGAVTARSFIATQVTSSIIYESGSTRYGDTADDAHTFTGSLNVLGDESLNGDLYITGDTIQTGSVKLLGDSLHTGTYRIIGNTTKDGDLTITGDYNQSGSFELTGSTFILGTVNHNGNQLRTGDTVLTGGFTNNGTALFVGNNTHQGRNNHEGRLTRIGDTNLEGQIKQVGDSSYKGKSSISGSFVSSGSLTSVGTTTLSGEILITGSTDINISGSITQQGELQRTGSTSQLGDFTLEGNTTLSGQLNITGSTEINISGSISQEGNITQLGDYIHTGQHTQIGDLTRTGQTNLVGNLNVNGVVTAKQYITDIVSSSIVYRSGDTQFGDTLDDTHTFTGDVLTTGSLTSIGNLEVTGSAFVKNRVQANSVDSNYFMSPKVVPDTVIPPNYNMRIFHDTSITGELFISQNSDVYVPVEDGRDEHPNYDSINLSVNSGTLTGADIVSDIDIDLTTNNFGHLIGATGTVSSRTLTLGDLGYTGAIDANKITDNNQLINGAGFVTSSGNLTIGTDSNLNATGSTVVEFINITDGVIESHTTRTLTLGDLGYTGDLDATNSIYVHPTPGVQGILVDTAPLTGSRVFSDVQFELNTDTAGHVVAATGSFNTRLLTLNDLGYVPSTDVTVTGENYITAGGLDNQTLTLNKVNLATQVTGTLPASNMAAIALTTVQEASNEGTHLALTTEEGDVVVRSDENKSYIHNGGTAGTIADFTLLATPTDAVLSVNGGTGAVTVGDARLDQVNTFDLENIFAGKITAQSNIELDDYSHIKIGSNLDIYTDLSNNSIISENGTGDLLLLSNNELEIKSGLLGENFAKFTKDGPIELYYDNTKRFETTATGINITGNLGLGGTAITPTATEINYLDGVTSNIQTQIDSFDTTSGSVTLNTDQTITGVKTFSNDLTVTNNHNTVVLIQQQDNFASNGYYSLQIDNTAQTANLTNSGGFGINFPNSKNFTINGLSDINSSGGATFADSVGIGITPTVPLDVDGAIRSTDYNSGNYFQIVCDGTATGHSFITNAGGNITIEPDTDLVVKAKLTVDEGDIEVDDIGKGLILKSPDGTRYRITVANGGTLNVSAV